MDEDVSRLADSLLRQETPDGWQRRWEGPEDPIRYIRAICSKCARVQKWAELCGSGSGSLLQGELDLSDLFHPDTFLGALRQLASRLHGVPMDELRLVNSWSRGGVPSKSSIRAAGLLLEGASFDGARLSASAHDSPPLAPVPPCALAWVPRGEAPAAEAEAAEAAGKRIRLPLYLSGERERVVAHLGLPAGGAGGERDRWLQAGVVLFINSYVD